MSRPLDTQSTVTLILNGEQAKTSLRDITRAVNATRAELSRMNEADNPELYRQRVAELRRLTDAQRERRSEIFRTTEEIEKEKNAQKGFFADFKKGFSEVTEMAGKITAGTLIYKGISGIIDGIKSMWDGAEQAYDEAQRTQTQLQAALKSTGGVVNVTKQELLDYQQALMDQTGVDDDVIAKGEEMLLTFTNIRGKIYQDALPAIVDMTAAMNNGTVSMEGIQSTSILVGKALNDPIKGMTALRKVGVSLDEQQRAQIETMVKGNDVAGAQALILKELQKEFGGTAKAIGDSDVGAMQKFNTRVDNIKESIGQWIVAGKTLAAEVLNPFLGFLESVINTPLSEKLHEDQRNFLAVRTELDSNNTSIERRHQLINDLKEQYPGYLSQIDTDKVKNSELLPILDKINNAFVLRIAYQKRSEGLDKAVKNEADALNDSYDAKQKLMLRIADIQQMVSEDGIKFTIKGNNEQEKSLYIYKNLINALREQAKTSHDLDMVLASNKYQNLIAGLNVYNNGLVDSNRHLKQSRVETKRLTDDLTAFKKSSGYNDTIPGADMLDKLAQKVKILQNVLADTDKKSKDYAAITGVISKANQQLKDAAVNPDTLKQIPATLDAIDKLLAPKGGPTKGDQDAAARKLAEFNKELESVRVEANKLAESAAKGTIGDLDAQIQVIKDKYKKVVDEIKKLLADPHATAAIRKDLNSKLGSLKTAQDDEIGNKRTSYAQEQDAQDKKEQGEELKAAAGRIDNVYNNGQSELDSSMNTDLNAVKGTDPEAIEAQRLNIQEAYAAKRYELEQKHLEDLKTIYQAYGQDTGALDKKIADNTIKENDRAAKLKERNDKAYIAAKKETQQLEMSALQQGSQFLESVLSKNSAAYKAALIVDKAVAIASVVMSTEVAIGKFAASVAYLGLAAPAAIAGYATAAHISEAISIASIIASAAAGLAGDKSDKPKAAKGALIPQGPSHGEGGIDLVNNLTGEPIAEMEGGEPIMILSKDTYRNNGPLINELLYNSQYRNGAPVTVNTGYATRPATGMYQNGGVLPVASSGTSPAEAGGSAPVHADQAETHRLLADIIDRFEEFSKKPWDFSMRNFIREYNKINEIDNDVRG